MSAFDELPSHRTYTKVQEAYISYFNFNKQSSSKHDSNTQYMWMSLPIFNCFYKGIKKEYKEKT